MSRGAATLLTYRLKITAAGCLSLAYSYRRRVPVDTLQPADITLANGPLPASLRFGFAGSTGGSNNIHEILCFQAQPQRKPAARPAST